MNRDFYYSYILDKIELLSSKIQSNGRLNILNLNIHAEFFYRDLCNLIYDYNLINANSIKSNMTAFDLVDEKTKTVIQVSSTCTKRKVNETLSKDNLEEYKNQGYTLKFIFFADAKNLKKGVFDNKYNIPFDPSVDIIDKDALLNHVLGCEVDKQREIYELFKGELGEKPNLMNISTNLAELINLLSEEDLGSVKGESHLHEYNLDKKIKHNTLEKIQRTIHQYKIYYSKINAIYKEFDKQGNNKSLSVFHKLASFYTQETLKDDVKQAQMFFNIVNRTVSHIKESQNYRSLYDEELEQCVSIIVVDAFIRCEIFENPEGYNHVITERN